ncbi:hypothetical protein DBV15_11840, partial [Temnothorax longispinosus]
AWCKESKVCSYRGRVFVSFCALYQPPPFLNSYVYVERHLTLILDVCAAVPGNYASKKYINMPSCAVKSCRSYTGKKGSENLRFFRFPADPVMSEQWKVICGNENINVKNARICSLHFHANAYKEASWMQSVLGAGHTPKKARKLRTDAIPTECLELILNQ